MKEVYQALTVDVIGKCAFGIEVNSLKSDQIDISNPFFSSAVEVLGSYNITNRWMSYLFLFFNIFPELAPSEGLFPAKQMDCKLIQIKCNQLAKN